MPTVLIEVRKPYTPEQEMGLDGGRSRGPA